MQLRYLIYGYRNFRIRKEKHIAFLALLEFLRATLKIIVSSELLCIVLKHFHQFFGKIYHKMAFLVKKIVCTMTE